MFDRPLAVIDIESTGVDPENDRIIDLSIVYVDSHLIAPVPMDYRFNPGIPIPAEATAIHGITDADVLAFPPFKEAAAGIAKLLTGVDLAGYAPRALDLPLLAAEFERAGVEWDFTGRVFDVCGIYKQKHPRDLSAAVKMYLGREHEDAHGALPDTIATAEVLLAQLAAHPDLAAMSADELARYSNFDRDVVDLAGKLARDKDGDLIYAFGKHLGLKVRDLRAYASWMMRSNFPANTRRKLQEELERLDGVVVNETTGEKDQPIPF